MLDGDETDHVCIGITTAVNTIYVFLYDQVDDYFEDVVGSTDLYWGYRQYGIQ